VPAGKSAARLAELIRRLALQNGTPLFPPHVTLLGSLREPEKRILETAEHLAQNSCPFPLKLSAPEGQEEFYRTLYLPAGSTRELESLHEQACRCFQRLNVSRFFPHLSLLYGSLDRPTKKNLISEITLQHPRCIQVEQLEVYATEGPVENWQKRGEFPLTGVSLPSACKTPKKEKK
jgi:2'-5' RNA ligase